MTGDLERSLAAENSRLRLALRQEQAVSRRLRAEIPDTIRVGREMEREACRRSEYAARERDRLLTRIVAAWADPGPVQYHHRRMKEKIRHQMPVLARLLDTAERRGM